MTLDELKDLEQAALTEIRAAASAEALDALRVKYLGRKGILTGVLRSLGQLDPETRRDEMARRQGLALSAGRRDL